MGSQESHLIAPQGAGEKAWLHLSLSNIRGNMPAIQDAGYSAIIKGMKIARLKKNTLTFDELNVRIVTFAIFVLCIRFRHAVLLKAGRHGYVRYHFT